jgi:hypothetical protein
MMDWVLSHWDDLVEAAALIIAGASIIAKLTPTMVDDNLLGKFIVLMDKLGLNNQPTLKRPKEAVELEKNDGGWSCVWVMAVMAAMSVIGCGAVTSAVYGPSMTPNELQDAIYADSYALGAICASGKTAKEIKRYEILAENAKLSPEPYAHMTKRFLQAVREGDTKDAIIWGAARRLYKRIGARIVKDRIDISGLDFVLLNYAADAYIDGLYGRDVGHKLE